MATTTRTCSRCDEELVCAFEAAEGAFVCSECQERELLRGVERRATLGRVIIVLLVCLVVGISLAVSIWLRAPAVHEPLEERLN